VDVELAKVLDLKLGDVLTLDIQGLPLDAVVTSFREIHWQAVRPNSLVLLSPGEIEEAPRQHVASFRIDDSRRYDIQSELIEKFPNLTVIDVTEAAKTIKLIIDRISVVFRGLGSLAILAGLLILSGAVASGRYARQRESMLLKVVGATRATLRKILITEQVALSTFGALAGWLLAEILSRGLWPLFFDVPIFVPYGLVVPFLLFTVMISTALGAAVSRKVSNRPALEILREE
jgi:putative ABC transport system permease protein